jgi:anti-sigma regulatory factor (Ser/Thr protein kinase)
MATDPARVEFTLDNDPRLFMGVSEIVRHSAQRAGFSADTQRSLAEAAVEACRETFPLVNGNDTPLRVVVADFSDRVEVTIEHSGEPLPTAGLESFCAGAGEGARGISNALLNTTVDRVKYDTRDGRSRMTLVKYRPGFAPKP